MTNDQMFRTCVDLWLKNWRREMPLSAAQELQRVLDDFASGHDSDCSTNNAPALPVGPCDCALNQTPNLGEQ